MSVGRRTILRGSVASAATFALGGAAHAATWDGVLTALAARAAAAGVSPDTVAEATRGLTPDPTIPGAASRQPEFERPLATYLEAAAGPGRVAVGRERAERYRSELATIAAREGVPGPILLAAWGIESDYGRIAGDHDSFRALVTLAATRADASSFLDEAVTALQMLERGVPREKMRGSWAGAMGDPQFMPSAYLRYAVAFAGGARPDIWTDKADVLASVAHFLAGNGWRRNLRWGFEIILPAGFDFPTLQQDMPRWRAAGLRRADGGELPDGGTGTLFLPAGADGPAFLLTNNFWVLKSYNTSDSYALSLGVLADRIAGAGALARAWPAHPVLLPRADRIAIQTLLAARGFYDGACEGKFGPASRDAIHRFQRDAKLQPADGFATPALLRSLRDKG